MKGLFTSYLARNELRNDKAFFWAKNFENQNQDKKSIIENISTSKSISRYKNRSREKSFQRLYNQIKNSLDKKISIKNIRYISNFSFSLKSEETFENRNKNLNKNSIFQCKNNKLLNINIYNPINKIINTSVKTQILLDTNWEKYRINNNKLIKINPKTINLDNEINNLDSFSDDNHFSKNIFYPEKNLLKNIFINNNFMPDINKLRYKKFSERIQQVKQKKREIFK